jgi:uncharacterized protein
LEIGDWRLEIRNLPARRSLGEDGEPATSAALPPSGRLPLCGDAATWNCSRCAECCRWPGHVLLTDPDIAALAGHLGMSPPEFIERHTRLASNRAQLSLTERADGACIFLDGDACRVYEARPLQCRQFPIGWTVRDGCPVA